MKKRLFTSTLFLALFAALCPVACSSEGEEPQSEYLIVDTSTIDLPADGGSSTRNLSSNGSWTILPEEEYDWCRITPSSGFGDAVLTLRADANPTAQHRYAYFDLTAASGFRTLCVMQRGSGSAGEAPGVPERVAAEKSGSSVVITWGAVAGASEYSVHRSATLSGTYEQLVRVSGTSATDPAPLTGDNYYKVRAYAQGMGGYYSEAVRVYVASGSGQEPGGEEPGGEPGAKPAAPTAVSATNVGNAMLPEVEISWNAVPGATSYKVYRSSSASGFYTQIGGAVSTTRTSDYAPLTGANYYKVKAVNDLGESDFSSYVLFRYDTSSSLVPATPVVSVSGGSSSLSISWTVATGSGYGTADSYEVYKRNPDTGVFDLLGTTRSKSYSDRSLHPGINRYAVVAVNDAGESGTGMGASSEIPLSVPAGFSARKSGTDVVFSWSRVSGATGYQIFSSTSASGNYTILDQIDGGGQTSHTRYYPASGTVYFKIKAVWSTAYGGSPVYSNLSSYKSVSF